MDINFSDIRIKDAELVGDGIWFFYNGFLMCFDIRDKKVNKIFSLHGKLLKDIIVRRIFWDGTQFLLFADKGFSFYKVHIDSKNNVSVNVFEIRGICPIKNVFKKNNKYIIVPIDLINNIHIYDSENDTISSIKIKKNGDLKYSAIVDVDLDEDKLIFCNEFENSIYKFDIKNKEMKIFRTELNAISRIRLYHDDYYIRLNSKQTLVRTDKNFEIKSIYVDKKIPYDELQDKNANLKILSDGNVLLLPRKSNTLILFLVGQKKYIKIDIEMNNLKRSKDSTLSICALEHKKHILLMPWAVGQTIIDINMSDYSVDQYQITFNNDSYAVLFNILMSHDCLMNESLLFSLCEYSNVLSE